MKKAIFVFFTLLTLYSYHLFGQQATPKDLAKVVSELHEFTSVRPQEKIHIHFDKPFYSVGDTVWFKVYLVNGLGHKLSSISKIVYIDIVPPTGKSKHLVVPINAGMASAQLVLVDSLYQAGDYPLRAYTQWMRNAGEDYFFNHTLRVGDVLHYKANVSAIFGENEQGLTAELTYSSAKGNALSAQEVNYKLKQGEKVLSAGKITTDLSGKAGVIFPADKIPKEGKLVLETISTLKSGSVLTNRFTVNTGKNILAVDFFPEGGSLVAGIRSKVAFKAVGKDGLGMAIRGHIENEKNEKVSVFETSHAGMGVFALLPQTGGSYTAVLSDELYKGQRFVLPKPLPEGFVLSTNPTATDDILVRISRSAGIEAEKEVRLVIQANGEVQQAVKLPMNSNSITFTIQKSKLADGINQLTLFSADNRPLAERLVFVQQKQVNSILESDKPEYATRDLVKLKFDNADGVVGGYSVAVVKSDKITLPEEKQLTIYSNLLLSSDLKGNIEVPNYYFTNPDARKMAELDALLLTQGWRRFSWTEVLSEKAALPKYTAEEGLEINGNITTLIGGKPVPNAKIKLLATKEMLFLDTVSNATGRFSFKDLQLSDSVEVVLRASGAKESNNVKVVLDEVDEIGPLTIREEIVPLSIAADTAMKAYLSQTSSLFDEMERTGRIIQGTTLKTVEIITKKKVPEIKGSVYPFAASPPDYTFEPDKLQEMVNLETHLKGLMGVQVKQQQIWGYCASCKIKEGRMTILLNGMAIEDLSGINPRSLTGVQIIKGSIIAANMRETGNNPYGAVFLTMNGIPNKFIKPNRPPGFLQLPIAGYTYAREFYVPNYEVQKNGPKNDFRSTLFWKPNIITGEDGKAEFSFYTSDEPGQYRVTLEGIDVNGQLCRKISYLTVK
ncbi:carboxypeptidase-like regulatory domain-containing protein [Pedobacter sp. Du54]|uniref:carboxypeptidase-like regulatory domain-containing protein n=1 Tax=Pedobacter anseongensis TaxID=3133439 RepID=UPI00309EFB75